MDLLQKTKQICLENNIKPARSRGQNFLIKEDVYDLIIKAAEIDKNDTILEVGPGLGFLTEKLAQASGKVIAVELDEKLASLLKQRFAGVENLEIVNKNILDIGDFELLKSELSSDFSELSSGEAGSYKIVANLPYNITSIFLRKFLESKNRPQTMTLMLQKEVAERIVARAGKMSLLAVSVQFFADAKIIAYVPKTAFWPEPEVDSAVIKLEVRPPAGGRTSFDHKEFFRLVRIGFSSRRKMLKNNLASGYKISQEKAAALLKKCGFSEKIRAQELGVKDWLKLFEVLDL